MGSRASLNHIYRTVWNHALGAMVAVAEIASGRGKSSGSAAASAGQAHLLQASGARIGLSALAIACAWGSVAGTAQANPNGGVAIHGQATQTTHGNQLLVTTQNGAGTNHSAINWQSFSIPTGSSTYFAQPGVASTVINRVVTNTPSLIFGTLGSNGNVVLVNQSGITVGAGALVDTAGFTASALRMTDADAIAGRLRFGDSTVSAGGVSVQGNILARSGDVVLIGSNVSTGNSALVQAPNGSTLLAAGQQIEITGRGLEGISMVVQAPTDSAVNLGTLNGDAVGIFAGTLKTAGAIAATAVTSGGGKVYLKAVDKAELGGSVSAKAQNGLGGAVHATADKVVVKAGALIDVSGQTGGGEALIGGGYQGKDARLSNARLTDVEQGAFIKANAIAQGNGGTIVVWSDDTTTVQADLSARGGALGGKGGLVETSGKKTLHAGGAKVSTLAADGSAGLWLLDPGDINIVHSGYGSSINVSGPLSTITDHAIRDALDENNVSISTSGGTGANGDIVFDSTSGAVDLSTTSSARSLTFSADRDISFTGSAGTRFKANGAGSLSVTLTAGRNLTTDAASSFVTKGGNVTLTAVGSLNNSAAVTTLGGNVSMTSTNGALTTVGVDARGKSASSYSGLNGGYGGNVTLIANNGTVSFSGAISASGGDGDPYSASSGGNAGSVTITASGTSGVSALGKIETLGGIGGTYSSGYGTPVVGPNGRDADVVITAGHRVDLLDEVRGGALVSVSTTGALNQVECDECSQGIFGASVTLSGSQVSLRDVSTTGGNINITASDSITLNASIDAGSGNLALTSGAGGIGGGGSIDAAALSITSSGDVDLSSGHHHVETLSANLTGTDKVFEFRNNNSLDLGTISAVQSQIYIENTSGALHLTGNLTAGTSGQTNQVVLVAWGYGAEITQETSARIKTTHLDAFAPRVDLGNALNEVNQLDLRANTGYGAMVFKNSGALQLGNINGDDLAIDTSTGNGAVTQGYGSVVSVANASFNSGSGSITLNKTSNVIGNLYISNAGDVVYRGNGARSQLNLNGVTAGSVDVLTGGDIYFQGDMTVSAGNVAVETSNGVIDMVPEGAVALGASGNITLKATKGLRIGNLTSGAAGDAVVMVSHTSSEPEFGFDAGDGSIVLTGGGRWLAYVGPGGVSNDFGNLRATANFKQYDAVLGVTPVRGTGNGVLHARSNSAYGTGLAGTPTKVYDGTTAISHDAITVIAPLDQNDEDNLSSAVLAGGEFNLDNPDIGTNKMVTANRLVFSNVQASEGNNLTVYYGPNSSFGSSIGTVTSASLPTVGPPSSDDPNSFVNNFLSQFRTALNSQNFDVNDPLGLRQRDNEGVVVEGEICAR